MKSAPGVVSARLNLTTRRLAVVWRDGETQPGDLIARLARAGYRAYPFEASRVEADDLRRSQWLLKCLAVSGFAAMNVHASVGRRLGGKFRRHRSADSATSSTGCRR